MRRSTGCEGDCLRDRARSGLPPRLSPGDAGSPPLPPGQLGCGRSGDPPASPAANAIIDDPDDGAHDPGAASRPPWQPEAAATLDEALALAERSGKLLRLWPVRAARAEAALLAGDKRGHERKRKQYGMCSSGESLAPGEIAWLLWQAGVRDLPSEDLAEPYALHIAGIRRRGCRLARARLSLRGGRRPGRQ